MARVKDSDAYKASRRARYAIARSLGYSARESKRLESLNDANLVREIQDLPEAPQSEFELSTVREAYELGEFTISDSLTPQTSRFRQRWFFQQLLAQGAIYDTEVMALYQQAAREGFVITIHSAARQLAIVLDVDPYNVGDFHIGESNAGEI